MNKPRDPGPTPESGASSIPADIALADIGSSGNLLRRALRAANGLQIDIVLIAAIMLLIWGSVVVHLLVLRGEARTEAAHTSADLARIGDQYVSGTIDAVDRALLFIRAAYARDPQHFDLASWVANARLIEDMTIQIGVVDKAGHFRTSNLQPTGVQMDLSDREHVRAQLGDTPDMLFISRPLVGRLSGLQVIQLTRKLFDGEGHLDGVLVASVQPTRLGQQLAALHLGPAQLTLIGDDGVLRVAVPDVPGAIGRDAPPELMRVLSDAAAGTALLPDPLGVARRGDASAPGAWVRGAPLLGSWRHLARYPLTVLVSLTAAQVLESFYADLEVDLAVGLGLSALVLLAGSLLVRHKRSLLLSRNALTGAVANISQGLMMIDAQRRVPVINRRAIELLGLPAELMARNPGFDDILRWQIETGEFGPGGIDTQTFRRFVEGGGIDLNNSVYERTRANGMVLEIRTNILPDGSAVRTYTDITERRLSQQRISFMAHHDPLTGLANRALLTEKIEEALRLSAGTAAPFAVLCLDLDRFKLVNDLRGHDIGDRLLMQVAQRLRNTVRDSELIARTGGDEFVVLQTKAHQPEAATALARRIIQRIGAVYELDGQQSLIGVSIGVALHPQDGTTLTDLLKAADTALYRAKEEGRSTFRFFHPAMNIRERERRLLEHDLREATAHGQFHLHFQPICEAESRTLLGFEALLRWEHPLRGDIAPGEFIPIAEECGLILQIGRFVLETACAAATAWPASLSIAVNISPAQFRQPDLPMQIGEILTRTGLAPNRLRLEVTEGLLIEDADRTRATMHLLKQLGVKLALDDFGTGHAGLSYLRHYPFDMIKIDRSFVQSLDEDTGARAIVSAILGLCRQLQLQVIAEGVETEEQLARLRELGCTLVQGFLLGRPGPVEEICGRLLGQRPARPPASFPLSRSRSSPE